MSLFIYYWGIDMKNIRKFGFLVHTLMVLNNGGNIIYTKRFLSYKGRKTKNNKYPGKQIYMGYKKR